MTDLINSSGDGRLGDPQGSVLLPMQPSIQENTNVKWGADELNAIQGKLAAAAGNAIGNLGDANFTGAVTGLVGDISAAAQELGWGSKYGTFHQSLFRRSSCWEKHCCSCDRSSSQPKHGTSVPRSHTSYCQLQL